MPGVGLLVVAVLHLQVAVLGAVELEGVLGHDVLVAEARAGVGIGAVLVGRVLLHVQDTFFEGPEAHSDLPFRLHLGMGEVVFVE